MSIQLQVHANRLGPGHFRLNIAGEATDAQWSEILYVSNWRVYKFNDDSGSFVTDSSVEFVVSRPDANEDYLEFHTEYFYGAYKIEYIGGTAVDSSYDRFFLREYSGSFEPFELTIEGFEDTLTYIYLDQNSLPNTVSQQLDMKKGTINDDGMSLTLVDIDGFITENFAPGVTAPKVTMDYIGSTPAISGDATAILPSSGYLWVNREAMYYDGLTYVPADDQTTLDNLERAQLETVESWSSGVVAGIGAQGFFGAYTGYGYPYYIRGRRCWLKSASGRVLWSGNVESLSPGRNLATYAFKAKSTLSELDSKLGQKLSSSMQVDTICHIADGVRQFSIRETDPYNTATNTLITLSEGIFDWTPDSQNTNNPAPSHICGNLKSAIEAGDGTEGSGFDVSACYIDAEGKINVTIESAFTLEFLNVIDDDALDYLNLTGLKYEYNLDSVSRPWNPPTVDPVSGSGGYVFIEGTAVLKGKKAFKPGVGVTSIQFPTKRQSSEYYAGEPDDLTASRGSVYIKIKDEIIHGSLSSYDVSDDFGVLIDSIDDVETDIKIEILTGSNPYSIEKELIQIGSEQIILGPINTQYVPTGDEYLYTGCSRGVSGTTAVAHTALDVVTVLGIDIFTVEGGESDTGVALGRAMWGTTLGQYDGGTTFEQVLTSKDGVEQLDNPYQFVLAILGEYNRIVGNHTQIPNYSLNLGGDTINVESFNEDQRINPFKYGSSFLSVSDAKKSYRELIDNILKGMNRFLYTDNNGRLSIGRLKDLMVHQEADYTILEADTSVTDKPTIKWDEKARIKRSIIEFDGHPAKDENKSKLIVNFNGEITDVFRSEDHQTALKAHDYHGRYSPYLSGGSYDTWAFNFAVSQARRYDRFLYSVTLMVPKSEYSDINIGDIVELTHSLLPSGDGTRGITERLHDVISIKRSLISDEVELVIVPKNENRYGGFNLGLIVTDYNAVAKTITVSSGTDTILHRKNFVYIDPDATGAAPNEILEVGDKLMIEHRTVSAVAYETLEVAAVQVGWTAGETVITFVSAPTVIVPALGDYLKSPAWDGQISTAFIKKLTFLADDDGVLGTADDEGYYYVNI